MVCCGLIKISFKDKLFTVRLTISALILVFSACCIVLSIVFSIMRESLIQYDTTSSWLESSTITLLWIGMAPLAVLPYIHSGNSEDVGELLHLPCNLCCTFGICDRCKFCFWCCCCLCRKLEFSKCAVCLLSTILVLGASFLFLFNFLIIGIAHDTYPDGSRDALNTVSAIIFGIGLFLFAELIFDMYYGFGNVVTPRIQDRPKRQRVIKKSEKKKLVFDILFSLFKRNKGSFYSMKMLESVFERDERIEEKVDNNMIMYCMKAIPKISYREHQRSKVRIYGLKSIGRVREDMKWKRPEVIADEKALLKIEKVLEKEDEILDVEKELEESKLEEEEELRKAKNTTKIVPFRLSTSNYGSHLKSKENEVENSEEILHIEEEKVEKKKKEPIKSKHINKGVRKRKKSDTSEEEKVEKKKKKPIKSKNINKGVSKRKKNLKKKKKKNPIRK